MRALEVTHAHPERWDHNGWHPHEHEVWFCARTGIDEHELADAQRELAELWADCCRLAAIPVPDIEHGLVMGVGATDYAAKWGAAEELTKAHVKQGHGSLSPFGLLLVAYQGGEHANRAAALFRDFADAFKGHHQLQWSRGLRDALGLGDEKSDEELAAQELADAEFVAEIPIEQWRVVRRLRLQAHMLACAERGGARGVQEALRGLSLSALTSDLPRSRGRPPPNATMHSLRPMVSI